MPARFFITDLVRFCPMVLMAFVLSGGPSCSEKHVDKKVESESKKKTPAERMQQFVIDISNYARQLRPGFVVIPQNGPELGFVNADTGKDFAHNYLDAIDAFAVEELFYNGEYAPDEYRIKLLERLATKKPVMAAEFIKDDKNVADAVAKCQEKGFLCYPRSEENYHYQLVPTKVENENAEDITSMSQVKNYLYLINNAKFDNKEDLINQISKTNFDMITIDLFFYRNNAYTKDEIERLKKKANGGKRLVICYMNIGAAEKWRYYWRPLWQIGDPEWIAKPYEGYEEEFWVKYWDPEWRNIIFGNDDSYLKKIIDAGFDGVFLDNTEAYYFLYKDK